MSKKLVIVESPVKAKTIEKYLGGEYTVLSCNGHIRDLPKKELGIDIAAGFAPTYCINEEKKPIIHQLKASAKKASFVYLASDDDREGESIAWHIKEVLGLTDGHYQRIVFRAITKPSIDYALKHARDIDYDLVDTQQARRILDRLVGYELSPILWRKVRIGLSAGRVQSVALKLIVEKEREIHAFEVTSFYKVKAMFRLDEAGEQCLEADLKERLNDLKEARAFMKACQAADFKVETLKKGVGKRQPGAPFTTSTLQQVASQQLGYSVKRTMVLAQRLYEEGHITYMRTDSVRLADEILPLIHAEIAKEYGKEYSLLRHYKTSSAHAQEAHEAIRPTHIEKKIASKDVDLQRLYKLIRQRTLASQMADALFDRALATISISNRKEVFQAKGELLTFPGFLAASMEASQLDASKGLPSLEEGQALPAHQVMARESFTKPPARYSEASLVKQLKELGIGRPSTYVPIISTIQQRGYVSRTSREGISRDYHTLEWSGKEIKEQLLTEQAGGENNKLFPSSVGMIVSDFLDEHCHQIMDYHFTAMTEAKLDEIAQKKIKSEAMLEAFYEEFTKQVERAQSAEQSAASLSRELGKDPATGKPVLARLSKRYGPLVQIGGLDDEEKPRFSSLREGQLLEQITLEDALKLFDLPREVGIWQDAPITAHTGRYGPYVKHKDKCYSLRKPYDPYSVTLEEAVEVIEEKQKRASGPLKSFDEDHEVTVWEGRYGPYIKTPKRNIKIPKEYAPSELTWQQVQQIIQEAPEKRKRRSLKRKK